MLRTPHRNRFRTRLKSWTQHNESLGHYEGALYGTIFSSFSANTFRNGYLDPTNGDING